MIDNIWIEARFFSSLNFISGIVKYVPDTFGQLKEQLLLISWCFALIRLFIEGDYGHRWWPFDEFKKKAIRKEFIFMWLQWSNMSGVVSQIPGNLIVW